MIITVCGTMKYDAEIEAISIEQAFAGNTVLRPILAYRDKPFETFEERGLMLAQYEKIRLADEVWVLYPYDKNVELQIQYAIDKCKHIVLIPMKDSESHKTIFKKGVDADNVKQDINRNFGRRCITNCSSDETTV